MKINNCKILFTVAFMVYGCKKPYNLIVTNNYANILVVEGIINTGGVDSIFIKLSRTGKVYNANVIPEIKAAVSIENAQGTVLTLTEEPLGTYVSPPLSLDNTKQYRLRIKTATGQTYLSDFVDAKISPPIDSIGYSFTSSGIQIYANTHDPTKNTYYYKYTYRETWRFTAKYDANYVVQGASIVARPESGQVYSCFGSDTSSRTIVNSTIALSQDVGYHVPIVAIESTSEKLETKYSILLKQQALTKDAFEFYENLQKNTEDLGSIFDAQPSQLIGNVHNAANPAEPVIGYITAGNTPAKRIFISKGQLPVSFEVVYPFACQIDSVYNDCSAKGNGPLNVCLVFFPVPPATLLEQPLAPFGGSDGGGWEGSTNICTECTLRGHTAQPAFWK